MTDLANIQLQIRNCKSCPLMVGTPVHGAQIESPILLIGQAPGPHEAKLGKPFAYTAGKTLFRWFHEVSEIEEEKFRQSIYMSAVARCFPGKAKGGGDRVPSPIEIESCRKHLQNEVNFLHPKLVIAVGKLAIEQVLGPKIYGKDKKLVDVIGKNFFVNFLGQNTDVICLPHPSGLSSWHKVEPGKTLLQKALVQIVKHPTWNEAMEKSTST